MKQGWWNLVHLSLLAAIAVIIVLGYWFKVSWNLTPSLTMGIWYPAERRVTGTQRGDVVVFCPPDTALFRKAKANGIMRWGRCSGGYAPLMKRVVAVAGDVVEVDEVVRVNGREIEHSRVIPEVAAVYGSGMIRRKLSEGEIFVMGDVDSSFDGRYWGVISVRSAELRCARGSAV